MKTFTAIIEEQIALKNYAKDLKDQAMEIISYEKKEMIPLTYDENKYYEKKKYCRICKKKVWYDKESKSKYDKVIIIS